MDITITNNVVIASTASRPLKADLYVPQTEGAGPRPAVVLVFGGGWSTNDKSQQKGYGIKLSKAGFVCVAADYRWSSEAVWPAQLEDVQAALAWLHTNAATYNVDPKRIGISGNSSGGHLALMSGLSDTGPRVAAVCAFYPPTDLVSLAQVNKEETIPALFGGSADGATLRAASPLFNVRKGAPPVMLLTGDADARVPSSQSHDMYKALRDARVPTELHVFPQLGHGFDFDREGVLLCSTLMIRFFNAMMK
jgi:acetyl esterase/lipase